MFFMKMITFKLLRRNLWTVLLVAFSFCTFQAAAGVPRKMAYQIMALNPTTGQVLANRDVNIRIELRQDKTDGQAVWHQDFEARTDEAGICQLTLELAEDIDWASADYYLATLIDGKECGASQVMSVPYALQAGSVEGVVTKREIIGSWLRNDGRFKYIFNEDGSGYKLDFYYDNPEPENIKWMLDNLGRLVIFDEGRVDVESISVDLVIKLTDSAFIFGDDIYQKQ